MQQQQKGSSGKVGHTGLYTYFFFNWIRSFYVLICTYMKTIENVHRLSELVAYSLSL